MDYVSGDILTAEGLQKGYVGFNDEGVVEQGRGSPPLKPIAQGVIIPFVVNAHTHIGDSFIKKKKKDLPRTVNNLFARPDGLKHRLLQQASEEEILQGMHDSFHTMIQNGTSSFCDFREGGQSGLSLFQQVKKQYSMIHPLVLARSVKPLYNSDEINHLLSLSDGIGLSSISDMPYDESEKIARHVKQKKKLLGLHASEVIREDIDQILDLKPDFLVHMIAATEADLRRCSQEHIPIVFCPRANAFFNLPVDIQRFQKAGVSLMLGTDNAMINTPNVLDEIQYLKKAKSGFTTEQLLQIITYNPRKALNLKDYIHGFNPPDTFIVLEGESLQPLYIKLPTK